MKFAAAMQAIVSARVRQLAENLDGDLHGFFEEESLEIVVTGHCRKVHPELRDTYPNGWCLLARETIDEAMRAIGAELDLVVSHG